VTPYYEADDVTLYLGDSTDSLLWVPGQVRCVLTDPPYGIQYRSNVGKRFDEILGDRAVPTWWARQLKRACLPAARIYWFCHESGIGTVQECLVKLGFSLARMLVWDKCCGAANTGDLNDFAARTEYIVAARAQGCSDPLRGARDSNLLAVPRVDPRKLLHPNEKPLALMEYLVIRSTNPGDLVLDPFCGSGVTLLAARNLGRKAIGFEIEEKYCEVAARRLEQGVLDLGGAA
jgi:DNA modification methylase